MIIREDENTVICQSGIRVNAYLVVERAVERGILWGLRYARKHVDGDPGDESLLECLLRDIMNELCEVLEFSE